MASHFVTDQAFERQQTLLQAAEDDGKVVYRGESDPKTRRMGFSLVKLNEDGIGEDGKPLTEEEIFGVVLPIIPVSVSRTPQARGHASADLQSLDKAIDWVNARPHPLAIYVCSTKKSVFTRGELEGI